MRESIDSVSRYDLAFDEAKADTSRDKDSDERLPKSGV